MLKGRHFINGEWKDSKTTFDSINPANQEIIGVVSEATPEDVNQAITKAQEAFYKWKKVSPYDRYKILSKIADLLRKNKKSISELITLEEGKPISEAEAEVELSAGYTQSAAEWAKYLTGEIIPSYMHDKRLFVIKEPLGVVAAITPWNFPIAMIARKIIPALATGCTVVLKPAEQTPLCAVKFFELMEEAQLPPGVANLILTSTPEPVGRIFLDSPIVRCIAFTGSLEVGKYLMQGSAKTLKRLCLELGGNAPFIVFDDCPFDKAIDGVIKSKFRNSGQTCISTNRLYVQETIYESFVPELINAVKNLTIGPLVDKEQLQKVKTFVDEAVSKGAKIACGGGSPPDTKGFFFQPTVLLNVPEDTLVLNEEIFGPVLPVVPFSTQEEVVKLANSTRYGLAAYVYTSNSKRMWQMAEELEFGIIGINDPIPTFAYAPFGGIKESGFGREGGKYALDEFVNIKYISINLT